jgi:hypothetical protein
MTMCPLTNVLTFSRRLPVYSRTFLRAMLPAAAAVVAQHLPFAAKILLLDVGLQAR